MKLLQILALALIPMASCSVAAGNWKSVQADNGAVYRVNVGSSVQMAGGWVMSSFYEVDDGDPAGSLRAQFYIFDCHGHMQQSGGPLISLAPRSVGRQIEALVCNSRKP